MIYDILILLYFMLMLYYGYKKGFVRSMYSIVSLVVSLIVTYFMREPVTQFISSLEAGRAVVKYFENSCVDFAATECANALFSVVATVIIYMVVRFIMQFIIKIFDFFVSLPLIRTLNSFLGLVLRALEACIWIFAITNFLYMMPATHNMVSESVLVIALGIIV